MGGKAEPFENHSALEIAEQLTLLDHLVFKVIPYEWVSPHLRSRSLWWKKKPFDSFCSHLFTLAGNSSDKAGWRTTKMRRRRISWGPRSTSTMYAAFKQDRCSAVMQTIHPSVFVSPPDKQPHRHGDPALRGRGHPGGGHREMGGRGRHLPVSPQLQRRPGDHLLPQSQLCVPPEEDLAQGVQAGAQRQRDETVGIAIPSRARC